MLIGAGDGAYLAKAGLVVLAAYAPLVLVIGWSDAGFTWLWVAYGGFIAARLATLWLRQRRRRLDGPRPSRGIDVASPS